MVFEQIFRSSWIYYKENAFFLGLIYSIIGIFSARLIFPSNSGIMSLAFISVLLVPSLSELLRIEANQEIKASRFSIKRLVHDHSDIFRVYISMFLGVFVAYAAATALMPTEDVGRLFASQLKVAGISGAAVLPSSLIPIVFNNILVFVVSFVLSFIYGAGAVIFLVWNASVWGVVFSYFVRAATALSGEDSMVALAREVVPFMPHMVSEGAAYIGAAIVGGIVSKAVLREKFMSKKFNYIMKDALIFLLLGIVLVIVAGFIEVVYAGEVF